MISLDWMDSILPRLGFNISLSRSFDRLLNCIERVQQRRALARLNDRLLADIGLSRADAEHEAAKPAWKE